MVEVKPNKQKKSFIIVCFGGAQYPLFLSKSIHSPREVDHLLFGWEANRNCGQKTHFVKIQILQNCDSSSPSYYSHSTALTWILKSLYLSRGIQPRLEVISLTTPQCPSHSHTQITAMIHTRIVLSIYKINRGLWAREALIRQIGQEMNKEMAFCYI